MKDINFVKHHDALSDVWYLIFDLSQKGYDVLDFDCNGYHYHLLAKDALASIENAQIFITALDCID